MLLHPLICERSRDAIAGLPDELREGLAGHWRRRARSEQRIGQGFAAIAPRLRAVGVAEALVRRCERAAAEEAEHAGLCRQLVGLYAGVEERVAELPEIEVPVFGTGDDRLEVALLIVGTCCINETLATAYIAACLEASTVACASAANRIHLREEIGHGRVGWGLLASAWMDPALRAALRPCLRGMLAANVPLWLRPDPYLPAAGVPGFGQPSHAEVCATIERAVQEVVLPGFSHVGLECAWPGGGQG